MGNKQPINTTNKTELSKIVIYQALTRNSYDFLYVIGKGGFGKVLIKL